jgi:hypothetical protein
MLTLPGCIEIKSLAADAYWEIQPDIFSFLKSRGDKKLGIHCVLEYFHMLTGIMMCIIIIIIIIIIISGVELCPLRTAATSGLLYKLQMIDEGDCGAIGGMKMMCIIYLSHEVHHLIGRGIPEQHAARPPSLPSTMPAGVVSLNAPPVTSHLVPPCLLPADAEVCSASCRFQSALTSAEVVTRNNIALCGHI